MTATVLSLPVRTPGPPPACLDDDPAVMAFIAAEAAYRAALARWSR